MPKIPRPTRNKSYRPIWSIAVFAALLLSLLGTETAHAQSAWVVRNQRSGGDELWGITTGPAGLVSVGANGAILQSSDGRTWTRRVSGTTDGLFGAAYGNGRYVAAGDHGRILSSPDGLQWTAVSQTATTQRLNNIVFGNQFVAVGEAGTMIVSADGVAWTPITTGTTRWLRGLAYVASPGGLPPSTPIWIATGEAGTLLTNFSFSGWTLLNSGITDDLESAAIASASGATVFSPYSFSIDFVAVSRAGAAHLLKLDATPSSPPVIVQVRTTTVPLNPGVPLRSVISGQFLPSRRNLSPTGVFARAASAPVVAFDDGGNIFTCYDSEASTLSLPNAWKQETPFPDVTIHSGTYVTSQESFYAAGENETIVECRQVFNGRAANLSSLGFVRSGENTLVAGLIVRGSAPKSVLLRGIGPALSQFGVSDPLAQPVLTLFNQTGVTLATTSGWSTAPDPVALAMSAARVGAFPLANNSADSALRLTLEPGTYTVQLSGAANTIGRGLFELYDLDEPVSGTSRAINLSTRGEIGPNSPELILGLTVQNPATRRFLVRAIGPGLAPFGLTRVLPDPDLRLTLNRPASDTSLPAINVTSGQDVDAIARSVGAFPVQPGGGDAVQVLLAPPGTYTFRVVSKNNSSGVVLLEIYEIPAAP